MLPWGGARGGGDERDSGGGGLQVGDGSGGGLGRAAGLRPSRRSRVFFINNFAEPKKIIEK